MFHFLSDMLCPSRKGNINTLSLESEAKQGICTQLQNLVGVFALA